MLRKTEKQNRSSTTGQGILELLIALAILVISFSTGIVVIFGGQAILVDTHMSQQALNLARQDLEEARAFAAQDFSNVISSTVIQGAFTKKIIVTDVDFDTKKIVSRVSWQKTPAYERSVELKTLVTNWVPDVPLSGDWKNPIVIGSLDLGSGNEGTDLKARNRLVYMTATPAGNTPSNHDFFIIDVGNPSGPFIRSSINTGPGLDAVYVKSNYAYVANRDSNAQLQVIDIRDKNSPQLVKSYKVPGISAGVRVQDIFVENNVAYLATEKDSGSGELYAIDVTSSTNPSVFPGSSPLEVGEDANSVIASGTVAFLAKASSSELWSVDISSPSSMSVLGSYNPLGNQDGLDLFLIPGSSTLYLARDDGSNKELEVVNVQNPSSPVSLGSSHVPISGSATEVPEVLAQDYLVFLGTEDANKELKIYNIGNAANITFWSDLNFPQVVTGMAYERNTIYISVRSNDALKIITSQ